MSVTQLIADHLTGRYTVYPDQIVKEDLPEWQRSIRLLVAIRESLSYESTTELIGLMELVSQAADKFSREAA